MPPHEIAAFAVLVAGFLAGAALSERSLRGVDHQTQGLLLARLAPLRKAHIVGFLVLAVLTFLVPSYAWLVFVVYFAVACSAGARTVASLELPHSCRNGQLASLAAVFIGVSAGAVLFRFG